MNNRLDFVRRLPYLLGMLNLLGSELYLFFLDQEAGLLGMLNLLGSELSFNSFIFNHRLLGMLFIM